MKKKIKTITLEVNYNPTWVLCPGHVAQKEFNAAFRVEWKSSGGYKQKDLTYEYWVIKGSPKGLYCKRSNPGNPEAKPYTVTRWD